MIYLASGWDFCGKIVTGLRKTQRFSWIGAGIDLTLPDRFCVAKSNPCGILKSKQRFFATQFPAAANKSACGQFCMEVNESVNPATCQTLLLFSLSHRFGKPTVFLNGGGLRIKCENSSLVLRFCVAKSNPCGNIYEEFQKIQTFFRKSA